MVVSRKTIRHDFPSVIPMSICLDPRGITPGLGRVEPFSSSGHLAGGHPAIVSRSAPLPLVHLTVKNIVLFVLIIGSDPFLFTVVFGQVTNE